jgi:hypothetical protein
LERAVFGKLTTVGGLSERLLTDPFVHLHPICYNIDRSDPTNPRFGFASTWDFWVPSAKQLAAYGVNGDLGTWPKNEPDVVAMSAALRHDYPKLSGTYGGPTASVALSLRTLHGCPNT